MEKIEGLNLGAMVAMAKDELLTKKREQLTRHIRDLICDKDRVAEVVTQQAKVLSHNQVILADAEELLKQVAEGNWSVIPLAANEFTYKLKD